MKVSKMQQLASGQKLSINNHSGNCAIVKLIGSGGQGEVYLASLYGRDVAIKWFFPHISSSLISKIQKLIELGAPNEHFVWPQAIVYGEKDTKGFGYLMPYITNDFVSITDMLLRRVDVSFDILIAICSKLVDGFRQLHEIGLCHNDISLGNIKFNPINRDIRIVDSDSIFIEGVDDYSVLGTPRFMAPEIITGIGKPNIKTDLFSLSVLLFYLLFVSHPLEGLQEAKIHSMDLAAMNKLYGTDPIFIYDPKDVSNRPVPGVHDNAILYWGIYPEYLKEIFTQAFTSGLKNPEARVKEREWLTVFRKLESDLIVCSCKAQNFRHGAVLTKSCWNCGLTIHNLRIKTAQKEIPLNLFTVITTDIFVENQMNDSSKFAQVVLHPRDKNVWGLLNMSFQKWKAIFPDGSTHDVESNQTVRLTAGLHLLSEKFEWWIVAG